jgi:uncharacterized protein
MYKKETVLVLGASEDPARYSYIATGMLLEYGHSVICVGRHEGTIHGQPVLKEVPKEAQPDTVTLYLNPLHQQAFYDTIIQLKPGRVIFNPGTENPQFEALLVENNIEPEIACTLVLLRTSQF